MPDNMSIYALKNKNYINNIQKGHSTSYKMAWHNVVKKKFTDKNLLFCNKR